MTRRDFTVLTTTAPVLAQAPPQTAANPPSAPANPEDTAKRNAATSAEALDKFKLPIETEPAFRFEA